MEFGIRELIQFATLVASLAGAFAVVKSQLTRVVQDINNIEKTLSTINIRIDKTEANQAVTQHQTSVFSEILSPSNLERLSKNLAELQTEMRVVHKNLDKLYEMHNGKHPT
jgi:septal ring factor EnvC (AmiA/AmiB activator)|tara:strand:+ start:644 stop:976 length:333 start_codon:yes stop_codon:yes gene_type:complete